MKLSLAAVYNHIGADSCACQDLVKSAMGVMSTAESHLKNSVDAATGLLKSVQGMTGGATGESGNVKVTGSLTD